MFLGVVLHQAAVYFSRFTSDRLVFKLVAIACTGICVFETAFHTSWVYSWTVTHYGETTVIDVVPFELPVTFLCVSINVFLVNHFYAWRVYRISQHSAIPIFIVASAWTQLGIVTYVSQYAATHSSFGTISDGIFPVAYICLAASISGDFFLTGSMVYWLSIKTYDASAARGAFREIVHRSLQANVLALVGQIVTVVLFRVSNVGLWWLLSVMSMSKVSTFSLLASLNSRKNSHSIIDKSDSKEPNTFSLKKIGANTANANVSVHVLEETYVESRSAGEEWPGIGSRGPTNVHFDLPGADNKGTLHPAIHQSWA